jgi:hypothetical protein
MTSETSKKSEKIRLRMVKRPFKVTNIQKRPDLLVARVINAHWIKPGRLPFKNRLPLLIPNCYFNVNAPHLFTGILFFNTFDFMKRFKAYFFLLTFCFSTLGYSLELHYCKGQVTDVSFIGAAECVCGDRHDHQGMDDSCGKTCHAEKTAQKNTIENKAKGCCKTEQLSFYSSSLKALSTYHMPAFELAFAEIFNPLCVRGFYCLCAKAPVEYSNPFPDRDITILTRSFRI